MGWQALSAGLADANAEHRQQVIVAIGTIGPIPRAVQMIEQCLQDKNALVRQTAASTLGEMGARSAIPDLKTAMDDNDPAVSFTAAKALSQLGDETGREIFQQVMEGERTEGPGKFKSAVKQAKHKLRPAELSRMGVNEASGALLGPASIPIIAAEEAVKDIKTDPGAPGRAVAAGVLAKDPDPSSLAVLEDSLSDKNEAVRLAVVKALGERGNLLTIPKLLPVLSDDHHAVQYMAAASIVKLSFTTARTSASN